MKKIVAIIVLLAIVIAGYIAAGPFITIHGIKSGIEHQDSEKISAYVDFSALRTNLKEQFNALFMKQFISDWKDNPFAALGTSFSSKLVEDMVDSLVTPTSLSNLMAGMKPQQSHGIEGTQESNSQKPEPFKDARYTYDSPSKFSVWVKYDEGKETRLVLTRNGLSWKLSNILIPTNLFDSNRSASVNRKSSITNLPSPMGAVNDFAGVISAEYRQQMEQLSREVLEKTGTSLVVATITTIGNNEFNDYVNRLYSAWGIGKKGEDKGVLIVLALKERKVRIETGYGVEDILPDGLVGEIRDQSIIPWLKAGDYGRGLAEGMSAIAGIVAKNANVTLMGQPVAVRSKP